MNKKIANQNYLYLVTLCLLTVLLSYQVASAEESSSSAGGTYTTSTNGEQTQTSGSIDGSSWSKVLQDIQKRIQSGIPVFVGSYSGTQNSSNSNSGTSTENNTQNDDSDTNNSNANTWSNNPLASTTDFTIIPPVDLSQITEQLSKLGLPTTFNFTENFQPRQLSEPSEIVITNFEAKLQSTIEELTSALQSGIEEQINAKQQDFDFYAKATALANSVQSDLASEILNSAVSEYEAGNYSEAQSDLATVEQKIRSNERTIIDSKIKIPITLDRTTGKLMAGEFSFDGRGNAVFNMSNKLSESSFDSVQEMYQNYLENLPEEAKEHYVDPAKRSVVIFDPQTLIENSRQFTKTEALAYDSVDRLFKLTDFQLETQPISIGLGNLSKVFGETTGFDPLKVMKDNFSNNVKLTIFNQNSFLGKLIQREPTPNNN